MSQKILNKRSSVFNKTPLPSQMEYGEIAINFNHENPFLSILDSNGEIQKFLSETKTRGLIQDAKEDIDNSFYTKEEINNMFEAFDPSGEVDLDLYYTKVESDSKYQPISGMTSYLTVASAENLYQPKGNYLTEHQSLENYYTKSEADNKFLTEHQDLSDYALKSEIPDVSNFVTSAFTEATYAKKGEVPSDAYTKAETDTLLAGKANSAHTHDYETLTNKPDLSNFATKGEIPDTSNFITSGYTEEHYQPKGTYVVPSDLNDYALKSELPSIEGLATEAELANYQPVSAMTGYSTTAHTHDYSEIQNTPDLSGFASLSDIPDTSNFITSAFTEDHYQPKGNYLTEHQSLENYYTKSEADNKFLTSHQDLSDYALKSEIPDVSNFVTSAFTDATYAKKGEAPTDVYTKSESDSKFQPQSGMTDYALKSELPSTTGLASEEWVSNNFSSTAHTHSDLATKAELENYLTIVSASTTYATKSEIPDISDLATKSEIPDVSNFVTSAFTDATYAKKGEVPSDAYTKAETDTLLAGKANSAHTHTASEIVDLDVPKIWKGTLSEYTNLTEIDNDTLYVITDESEQFTTSGEVESMISGYTTLSEVEVLLGGFSPTGHTHVMSDITDLDIPSLEGYATETWVGENFQPQSGMSAYSQTGHTHSYNDLEDKPTIPSIEGLATEAELANYQPVSGMSGYSQTGHTHDYSEIENTPDLSIYLTEHQDISGLATKAELENYMPNSGMTDYALKSEIPSLDGLATEAELENYQPVSGMSEYSQTGHTHSNYAEKSELVNYQPVSGMSDYALASQIPSTTGLASETWVSQNFQPQSGMTNYALSGHTHSEYLTQTSADSRYARVVSCTQAEYDALVQNDQVEQGVLYCITESN